MNISFFTRLRSWCMDFIIFIIPLFVLIYLFPLIFKLTIPFIIAFLLYSLAKPLNHFLLRFHFPPFLSSFLSLVVVASIFGAGVWLLFSSVIKELQGLSDKLSDIYTSASQTIRIFSQRISSFGVNFISSHSKDASFSLPPEFSKSIISQLSEMIASFSASLLGYAKNIFGIFLVMFTAFITAFFMLKDKKKITTYLRALMGSSLYNSVQNAKKSFWGVVCGYLKAELLMGIIIFIVLLGGLSVLRVEYALLLSVLTAIIDAIPLFGAGIVLIPWAIISILSKNSTLGWGLISLYGICLLTRQICEPKIIGKNLGIHPLASIISIYIAMQLFGFLGIIIGPVCAVLVKSVLSVKIFQ